MMHIYMHICVCVRLHLGKFPPNPQFLHCKGIHFKPTNCDTGTLSLQTAHAKEKQQVGKHHLFFNYQKDSKGSHVFKKNKQKARTKNAWEKKMLCPFFAKKSHRP